MMKETQDRSEYKETKKQTKSNLFNLTIRLFGLGFLFRSHFTTTHWFWHCFFLLWRPLIQPVRANAQSSRINTNLSLSTLVSP